MRLPLVSSNAPPAAERSLSNLRILNVPLLYRRCLVAAVIGLGSALLCLGLLLWRDQAAADWTWPWRAARALVAGDDPYKVIQRDGPYPYNAPFFYPLPAALIAIPFSWLPAPQAAAAFFGFSAGLLAFGLTAGGTWWRLLNMACAPFLFCAYTAQWGPLVTAAALLPAWQWLAVAKPNLGLAVLAYRPSVAILPSWPIGWRAAVRDAWHVAPITVFPGVLMLLAVFRLRDPRARLLLASAFLPQFVWFYDQMPLAVVARSRVESLVLVSLGWLAWVLWLGTDRSYVAAQPYIIVLFYLPVLALIYRPMLLRAAGRLAGSRSARA
jgi:hypothetical protein